MRSLMVLVAGCVIASGALAHSGDAVVECEKVKQKIRHIQSKMRSGYSRAQGEKMEAQLRKLRALRSRFCR